MTAPDPAVGARGAGGRRAVFLDRDGVLNRPIVRNGLPYAPTSVAEFELYPEVPAACQRLRALGLALVVVTNQPDIARGTLDPAVVDAIHDALRKQIAVDGIYVCRHDDDDACDCRKPAPGLLIQAAGDLGLDLAGSVMVGDRWRDVEAGRRAGCHTVFIDRGYREPAPDSPDHIAASLAQAAVWIEDVVVGGIDGG